MNTATPISRPMSCWLRPRRVLSQRASNGLVMARLTTMVTEQIIRRRITRE